MAVTGTRRAVKTEQALLVPFGTNLQEQIWTGFRLAEGLEPGRRQSIQKGRHRGSGNIQIY